MRYTKLIEVLSTLDQAEFRKFEKYVRSPYFNTHEDTLRFFLTIKPYYPDFEEANLEPHSVFEKIYPSKKFNDSKLRTLRKYLLKLLMGFMGQEVFDKDEWIVKRFQLKSFIEKRLDKYVTKMFDEYKNELNKYPYDDGQKYLNLYHLSYMDIDFKHTFGNRLEITDFSGIMKALDGYYLTEKLGIYSAILNKQFSLKSKTEDISMINQILSYCKEHIDDLPVVTIGYYHMALLNQAESDDYPEIAYDEQVFHFNKLRKITISNTHNSENKVSLSRSDQLNFYHSMINYCIGQYKTGKMDFVGKLFELYTEMLDKELLFVNGILPGHHYKNISTLGLRLGQYKWTEEFIEKYKDKVAPELREAIYFYNIGHLLFYQEEFREALKSLLNVEFIDSFYKMGHHMLQLKIYYECNETESLLSLCTTFRTLLRRRQELTDIEKKPYMHFISFIRALYLIKTKEKDNLEKVLEEIHEATYLTEKDWLIQKAEELKAEVAT